MYYSQIYFIKSKFLSRKVEIEIISPIKIDKKKKYPLVIFNDGQDAKAVGILNTLNRLHKQEKIREVIYVGLFANEERMSEYGIACKADYLNRGNKARAHNDFVIKELFPFLVKRFPVEPSSSENAVAGYSLGALSALDLLWNNPENFGKLGAFSGAFWWRSKAWKGTKNCDNYRIAHNMLKQTKAVSRHLKFWFQAGTEDENCDRNGNGIIDAIDDTLDLIQVISAKGFRPFYDIVYQETKGGIHAPKTWRKEFPKFMLWAYGKE
jgi:enterochelin esterase-like enzyme